MPRQCGPKLVQGSNRSLHVKLTVTPRNPEAAVLQDGGRRGRQGKPINCELYHGLLVCLMQAERTCAAAPCISHFWQMGPWSACANGKSTRAVQCIDSQGGNATKEV